MKFSWTRLSGLGFIAFGIGGYFTGKVDAQTAINNVLVGIAIIGGRNAITKINKY